MGKLKNFAILLITLISGVAISCSDSDEPKNKGLVGTWISVETYDWYGKNEVGISYTFTDKGKVTCRMWAYKKKKKTYDKEYKFSYKFDGKNVTLKDSDGDSVSYAVSITGTKMTMNGKTYTKQ